jgi:hypothetical protein
LPQKLNAGFICLVGMPKEVIMKPIHLRVIPSDGSIRVYINGRYLQNIYDNGNAWDEETGLVSAYDTFQSEDCWYEPSLNQNTGAVYLYKSRWLKNGRQYVYKQLDWSYDYE